MNETTAQPARSPLLARSRAGCRRGLLARTSRRNRPRRWHRPPWRWLRFRRYLPFRGVLRNALPGTELGHLTCVQEGQPPEPLVRDDLPTLGALFASGQRRGILLDRRGDAKRGPEIRACDARKDRFFRLARGERHESGGAVLAHGRRVYQALPADAPPCISGTHEVPGDVKRRSR